MASASLHPDLLGRIAEYADQTQIEFAKTSRLGSWTKLGLPDMRGFNPHLRRVNFYKDQKDKNLSLWMLHDILHIAFYDFTTLHLGKGAWNNKERFLENHLASELFAVLALDYHYLIGTDQGGLAVELSEKQWSGFQKINLLLPPLKSELFCQALADLYLVGESAINVQEGLHNPNANYLKWLGHEVRYSSKQRVYVNLWWEDLQNSTAEMIEAQILNSGVAEGVWSLLQIFFAAEETWQAHLGAVIENKVPANLFAQNPKYKIPPQKLDFRLTDINALEQNQLIEYVARDTKKPSASSLFLFWQILSSLDLNSIKPKERKSISSLATLANRKTDMIREWSAVREIVKDGLNEVKLSGDQKVLSTFFLP
jgi:hypothetical protein